MARTAAIGFVRLAEKAAGTGVLSAFAFEVHEVTLKLLLAYSTHTRNDRGARLRPLPLIPAYSVIQR